MLSVLLAVFSAGCIVGACAGVFAKALVRIARRAAERSRFDDVDQYARRVARRSGSH